MTLPFSSFFKKISRRFSARKMLFFWYRHYKVPFVFLFLIVLSIGGWHWYYSFYQYRLSDEEKRQYIEQSYKEITFKDVKFHTLVDAFRERSRRHQETLKIERNIFEGKDIQKKETR